MHMMTILYQENMDDQKTKTYIHELYTRKTILNMAIVKVVYSSLQK